MSRKLEENCILANDPSVLMSNTHYQDSNYIQPSHQVRLSDVSLALWLGKIQLVTKTQPPWQAVSSANAAKRLLISGGRLVSEQVESILISIPWNLPF